MADKTVQGRAQYADTAQLEELRQVLSELDAEAARGLYGNATVIIGKDIKARDIYQAYLKRAADISEDLLDVRQKMHLHAGTLSLQQLGALSQRLSAENDRFKHSFSHGEEQFQTYRLIEKAVSNLEDAVAYWRMANRYRSLYRGSQTERHSDEQILRLKLQTAMNAIDELNAIIETRTALARDLAEE